VKPGKSSCFENFLPELHYDREMEIKEIIYLCINNFYLVIVHRGGKNNKENRGEKFIV
jgi:hypothetical protein